jgi:hypothetical protein|tara:strand:+ start:321 stop:524 length:204 start_codon:yes stop_codon:yes gene_type:complete
MISQAKNLKAGDYVALKNVPGAFWKVEETNGSGTVDVSNTAFAAYEEAVSVEDITKHITKAEAKHIK